MKEQQSVGVGRREFLLMSGTAVALVSVADRLLLAAPAAATAAPAASRLAVGFVPFELNDPGAETKNLVSRTSAVDARQLGSSDGHFIGDGLRIIVTGHYGSRADAPNVHLVAHFPGAGGKMLPVQVWGSRGFSSPTSFVAAVDEHQRIDMSLVININGASAIVARRPDAITAGATPADGTIQIIPLVLSLQNESDTLRLQRGSYLVDLGTLAGGADPDWSSIRLSRTGPTTVLEADGLQMKPAKSDFLVITTDYIDPHVRALSNP